MKDVGDYWGDCDSFYVITEVGVKRYDRDDWKEFDEEVARVRAEMERNFDADCSRRIKGNSFVS